jgi:dTDP-4-dehydrorhamnose 3,5-epimerase
MYSIDTEIPGVQIITPPRFKDDRGWFTESWNQNKMNGVANGLRFVQDNHSFSAPAGTVRGLHFQSPPHAQDKLVRVIKGSVTDVAVDIRKGSPTFGKWVSVMLSAENGKQLLVPKGFLHGFVTLEADTEVLYKCTDFYAPECDGGIKFDDPDLAIDWGMDTSLAVLSEKDKVAPSFGDFDSPFTFQG